MKINTQVRDIQSSGTTGDAATFVSSDITHLFNLLATNLYSRPITAVMRELGANAKDAHLMAGKPSVPFQVHIPTQLEPYFGVRDFGKGLSYEFMTTKYIDIGYSNKRYSDAIIGGLGIGRLSAFSYTDAYTVESIQNGEQRIYSIHLGEARIPVVVQMGNTLQTSEPDGFHVKVPVNNSDLWEFSDVGRDIYKYYDVQPDFNKTDYGNTPDISVEGEDKTWHVDNSSYSTFSAVMGGVSYNIEHNNDYPYNLNLTMFFDIGELDITPSRESLNFTERTNKAIKDKYEDVKSTLMAQGQKEVDNAQTLFEATKIYRTAAKAFRCVIQYGDIPDMLWNGAIISEYLKLRRNDLNAAASAFSVAEIKKVNAHNLQYHKRPAASYASILQLDPLKVSDIYITVDKDKRVPSRLKEHYSGLSVAADVYIINTDDVSGIQTYLKDVGYPEDNVFIFKDTVDDYRPTFMVGGKRVARPSGSIYSISFGHLIDHSYESIKSNKLFTAENDLNVDDIIFSTYVDVSGWEITSSDFNWDNLRYAMRYLIRMGHASRYNKLYVSLKAAKNPFGDATNFEEFSTYCKNALTEFEQTYSITDMQRTAKKEKFKDLLKNSATARMYPKDQTYLLPPKLKRTLDFLYKYADREVKNCETFPYTQLYAIMYGHETDSEWYNDIKDKVHNSATLPIFERMEDYDKYIALTSTNSYSVPKDWENTLIDLLTMIENSSKLSK